MGNRVERARNLSVYNLASETSLALEAMAAKDPRAAYDLGLRFFRGDGVKKDSYLAIKWMRDAGERGDFKAAQALGRLLRSAFASGHMPELMASLPLSGHDGTLRRSTP